jgi:hypothetical protein
MAKINSEFNYRYQVIGETPWEKIKTLHGFLCDRKRAVVLEEIAAMKRKAKFLELEHLKSIPSLPHVILELEADIIEMESVQEEQANNFRQARDEVANIEKLLAEYYELVEPTRLKHADGTKYTDDEMFEVNAANEFTVWMAREIQAEIVSSGRPSAAKIKNAMSNPITWAALKQVGLIPPETNYIVGSIDPTNVQLLPSDKVCLQLEEKEEKEPESITKKMVSFS